nr:MAG TPA: hypothetical protein [Caudoviricetes sp.]
MACLIATLTDSLVAPVTSCGRAALLLITI